LLSCFGTNAMLTELAEPVEPAEPVDELLVLLVQPASAMTAAVDTAAKVRSRRDDARLLPTVWSEFTGFPFLCGRRRVLGDGVSRRGSVVEERPAAS